jgi:hypothetical protein
MDCAECNRLSALYARLERAPADVVKTLSDRIETLSAREYMRLRASADEARTDYQIARTELEQHQRIHARASQAGSQT